MKILGPLLVLAVFAVCGLVLYNAKKNYENTPAGRQNFSGSLSSALDQAKTENKKVVAFFTASWCGPCQRMKKEVIPTAVVQAQASRFVWVLLDVDNPANQAAAREFGVGGIPSFHILNANGRELGQLVGGRDPESFAQFLAGY